MPEYLIAFNDEWVPTHTKEELAAKSVAGRAVIDEMRAADVLIFANGDGEPIFSDGPYIETKEHLGGFTVIEAEDDEAARFWAGKMAAALQWPQEVHRFPGSGDARPRASEER